MKQFVALVVIVLLFACKSETKETTTAKTDTLPSGPVEITGTIAGMDNGSLELLDIYSQNPKKIDTIEVKEGKFSFTRELVEPAQLAMRKVGVQDDVTMFFADPGKVTIQGYTDSMWASKIEGGETQKLFKEAQDSIKNIMLPGQDLFKSYEQAQVKGDMAEQSRLIEAYNKLLERSKLFAIDFSKKHGNTVLAPYLGLYYLNEPGKEGDLKEVYDELTSSVKASYFGKKVGEIVNVSNANAIGSQAADFTMADVNDVPVTMSSFRGKYLLIDFWASWCGPCRQENPNVVEAYKQYHPKGLEILGVSLDGEKEAWLRAIKADNLDWTQVSDLRRWSNEAAVLYGVQAIPANFLLDKQGKIIAKNLRGPELQQKLASLMP